MKKTITSIILMLVAAVITANAQDFFDNAGMDTRIGYSIGGTAPIGMPATIRKLNSYTPQASVTFGVDILKPIHGKWGYMAGAYVESKGMKTDAKVKNYHMAITRGGETMEGVFTGNVVTNVEQWTITVPLQATFNVNDKLMLHCGPYASYMISGSFDGSAYNGYLRVGDPTGAKVELGIGENERGTYDFSEHMRRMLYGVMLGADWYVYHSMGVYANISWGLNGIHHSNFKTIEQTLYPIYGTIGLTYKLK